MSSFPSKLKRCYRVFQLFLCSLSIVFLTAFSISFAQSQLGGASLEGIVIKAEGETIPDANITVKSLDTNYTRLVTSDSKGRFVVPVLPVGKYTIEVSTNGFKNQIYNIELTVGNTENITIKLEKTENSSSTSETSNLVVTSQEESLNLQESAKGTNIIARSIVDLPIRGRNFPEFVILTPAILQESDRAGLVIAGQRSINSNIAIDGLDFNNALLGNQRGGNQGIFFFPQVAIREFQVVLNGGTAEIGRTNAGFVNVVTKSGGNDLHGELFYFNRNKEFSSKDAFGKEFDNQQNQFGGAIGLPIKKDTAFLFLAFEQNFLRLPFEVKFLPQISNIAIPESLKSLEGTKRTTNNPTAIFVRTDFNLNSNNLFNLKYNYSRLIGDNFNPEVQREFSETANIRRESDSNGLNISLTSLFTDKINEIRFLAASDNTDEIPNIISPRIDISKFGRIGADSSRPRIFNATRYQVVDDFTAIYGANQLRFGVDININRVEQQRETSLLGRYDFSSLSDFLNQKVSRFRQSLAQFDPKDLLFRGTQKEIAAYFQDRINIKNNLTLTAGLRWEALLNPQPKRPNPNFPETAFIPNDLTMFQPRLGLALGLGENKKTAIRLSAGLYTARTPATLFSRVSTNNGLNVVEIDSRADSNILKLISFPQVFSSFPKGIKLPVQRVFGFQRDFQNPRSFQVAASVEQLVGRNTILSVSYTHNSTWDLQRRLDRNLFPPTIDKTGNPIFPKTRPNPTIGRFSINESTGHSTYDSMAINVEHTLAEKFLLQASYTLALNLDDDSNERNFSTERTLNPFDLSKERALSNQDVRHNFVMSGILDLPLGFKASTILVTHSGFPYTAVVGDDKQNDDNEDNDRAIINGQVSKRNSFRQPYFFSLDLRIAKNLKFNEKNHLEIIAEIFNVTRNTNKNFGVDGISVFGTVAEPNKSAGQALFAPSSNRYGGSRQLQIGVRYIF